MDIEKWTKLGIEVATEYGLKIIGAIVIWIIGSWVIKKIMKGIKKVMSKRDYEESLQKFLLNLISWIINSCYFISTWN